MTIAIKLFRKERTTGENQKRGKVRWRKPRRDADGKTSAEAPPIHNLCLGWTPASSQAKPCPYRTPKWPHPSPRAAVPNNRPPLPAKGQTTAGRGRGTPVRPWPEEARLGWSHTCGIRRKGANGD